MSSSSSSSSSSEQYSTSTSSAVFEEEGVTYYSNLKNVNSINNPVMGEDAGMRYSGYFDMAWDRNSLDIDYEGYGLRKSINNKGAIYCNDASRLFSMSRGYVGMTLSLPNPIKEGVYMPLLDDINELNEYILWGVNNGLYTPSTPGLYSALTPRGIEFTTFTTGGRHTITDSISDIDANTSFFIEFAWDSDEIDEYLVRSIIRVNRVVVAAGNQPIASDSIDDFGFYVLNTPFGYSNMECIIRNLSIYNIVPREMRDLFESSSSESEVTSMSSLGDDYSSFLFSIDSPSFVVSITFVNPDIYVDWGDGSEVENYTYGGEKSHSYSSTGSYVLKIYGECSNFAFSSGGGKLTSILSPIRGIDGLITFDETFSFCTSLTAIPTGLFDNCPNIVRFGSTFAACTSLTAIPTGLFDNCPNVMSFEVIFNGCTSLTTIPTGLFDNCPSVTSFFLSFLSCTSLTAIPTGLFDNCPNVTDFRSTFNTCSSLVGNAPDLWNRVPEPNGENCFYECFGLSNYSGIPLYWK